MNTQIYHGDTETRRRTEVFTLVTRQKPRANSQEPFSKAYSQRQLNLAWVVHRSWCSVVRIRRALQELLRWRTSLRRRIKRTEVRRAVNGIEESHVDRVEQVECFSNGFNAHALNRLEAAREPEINGLVAIALESVARLNAHPIVVAEYVSIGIKSGKLSEVIRRLNRDNHAHMKIVDDGIHVRRAIDGGVEQ